MQRRSRFVLLLGLALLSAWIPILSIPLTWNATFFHEISHGLGALVSGGNIQRIVLGVDGSGLCYTYGGSPAITLFAGYAGAILWGTLIYLSVSMLSRFAPNWILALLLSLLLVTLLCWARDLVTVLILLAMLIFYAAIWRYGTRAGMQNAVQFLGLYVLVAGVRSPTQLWATQGGDGEQLARILYIPEIVWILIWSGLGLLCLYLLYRHSGRRPSRAST